jgi:predicted aldo/keto reductase-like oxidoreductase
MLYRKNTVLERDISVIGFGGAAVSGEGAGYGFGNMSEAQAEDLLRSSWNAGMILPQFMDSVSPKNASENTSQKKLLLSPKVVWIGILISA